MKRSNQLRAHRAHLKKLLHKHSISVNVARDIIWTDDKIYDLQNDIDAGFDEWVKDDWPHAIHARVPTVGALNASR